MHVFLTDQLHVAGAFEDHHEVRAAELEVPQLLSLGQGHALVGGDHHRGNLGHPHGKAGDETNGRVDDDETSGLDELIAGAIEGIENFDLLAIYDGRLGFHIEVSLTLDYLAL